MSYPLSLLFQPLPPWMVKDFSCVDVYACEKNDHLQAGDVDVDVDADVDVDVDVDIHLEAEDIECGDGDAQGRQEDEVESLERN